MQKVHVHWFRKGLRIHDNPALKRALVHKQEGKAVLPLFIIDPHFSDPSYVGVNRYAFLLETLADLDAGLQKYGLRLVVAKGGQPHEVLQKLVKILDVDLLTFESDTEPYSKARDRLVRQVCRDNKVRAESFISHTLFDPEELFERNSGEIPRTYTSCVKILYDVPKTCNTMGNFSKNDLVLPDELKDPMTESISKDDLTIELYQNTPKLSDFKAYEGLTPGKKFIGGESTALQLLDTFCSNKKKINEVNQRTAKPTALKSETTLLSPYLKFGCMSARTFYWQIRQVYGPSSEAIRQIFFREWYYLAGHYCEQFGKMVGNKTTRQIEWSTDQKTLELWEKGMTGFPAVDASMRQLQQEGWINNQSRQLVACFLTRGDLWIHWELGARVFDKLLVDADWSINNGNWQWMSCSRFYYQYFNVYSPVSFLQKHDQQAHYVKKYCPELKNYPANLIYNPWKASAEQQKAFGCVIGKDYPAPIVDHDTAKTANKSKMADAYAKYEGFGNSYGKKLSAGVTDQTDIGAKTQGLLVFKQVEKKEGPKVEESTLKQNVKTTSISKRNASECQDGDGEDKDKIVEINTSKKRELKIHRKSEKKLKNQSLLKFAKSE